MRAGISQYLLKEFRGSIFGSELATQLLGVSTFVGDPVTLVSNATTSAEHSFNINLIPFRDYHKLDLVYLDRIGSYVTSLEVSVCDILKYGGGLDVVCECLESVECDMVKLRKLAIELGVEKELDYCISIL